jgi:lipoate-protein ligase A
MFCAPRLPKLELLRVWEDPEPRQPADSMAWDHALLLGATTPLLRVYRWAEACVSCGYFAESNEVKKFAEELPWVRRWTGGGLVRHGEDWAYTVIIPRAAAFSQSTARDTYKWIHSSLAEVLNQTVDLGNPFSLAVAECGNQPGAGSPCFSNPVSYDLLWNGQKAGGAGQRRTQEGSLFQGSLQLPQQQHPNAKALATTLAERTEAYRPDAADFSKAENLRKERYSTDAWNYLR